MDAAIITARARQIHACLFECRAPTWRKQYFFPGRCGKSTSEKERVIDSGKGCAVSLSQIFQQPPTSISSILALSFIGSATACAATGDLARITVVMNHYYVPDAFFLALEHAVPRRILYDTPKRSHIRSHNWIFSNIILWCESYFMVDLNTGEQNWQWCC